MKFKKFSLKTKIIGTSVGTVLSIGLIVGSVIAYQYESLLDVFLTFGEYQAGANSVRTCEQVVEEGLVLLKNEDNALPLSSKETKVALLGQNSVDFVYGGSGSGSVDASTANNLKQAFEASGFEVNSTLWNFYTTGAGSSYRKEMPDSAGDGDFAINEVPQSVYTSDVISSLSGDDVAIVSVGRGGGESADIPTSPLPTGYTYLQLDKNEMDLIDLACDNFEKVILLVNANNPVELGFLEENAYSNVKAAIWVGGVGQEGINAIPKVIKGDVNPSGRLPDTYAYDSLSAPSSANLGNYTISNSSVSKGDKYLVYGEGIYVGYRYYETRYEDVVLGNTTNYDYSSEVQYPFGYGLSYTEFTYSDFTVNVNSSDDELFDVSVKVTNDGNVAGKEVVQLYVQKPYVTNGPEVASIELIDFDKTASLRPGATETVTFTVSKEDLTTYDSETNKTYILNQGDYYFAVGKSSHDALNNILALKGKNTSHGMDYNGDSSLAKVAFRQSSLDASTYSKSETGATITNQFDDVDVNYYENFDYLSRSDWQGTYPTTFKSGSWEASSNMLADLEFYDISTDTSDDSEINAFTFTQNNESSTYTVQDLIGVDYDDEKWDLIVSQLSYTQMTRLIRMGGYSTQQLDRINLPPTVDKDGPSGISGTLVGGISTMAWPAEVVMAATFNKDLINRLGVLFGEDSIAAGVAGVYGPAANIHRSPYSGRNFEYFSEDPMLSYHMAKVETEGLRSKGTITHMKHYFLNDQETNRYGGAIFANEQSIREIYTKGFKGAADGGTNAYMCAMNRIGTRWIGAHKGAMTSLLRDEWGFEGMVITDQASVPAMFYQDIISGMWAGTDLWLNTNSEYWSLSNYKDDKNVQYYVHRAAKNIIYAITNSWAVDESYTAVTDENEGGSIANTWTLPWRELLITVDVLVLGLTLAFALYSWVPFDKIFKSKDAVSEVIEEENSLSEE